MIHISSGGFQSFYHKAKRQKKEEELITIIRPGRLTPAKRRTLRTTQTQTKNPRKQALLELPRLCGFSIPSPIVLGQNVGLSDSHTLHLEAL